MKTRWQIPLLVIAAWTARPPVRLTAQQRPWQATDYYKLTFVADPRLSPDGRRVAFTVTTVVEDKDRRHGEIWMAAADGSAPAYRYTSPSTEASSPSWSPDGSLLAFSSRREGSEEDVWFLRTGAPGGEAFQVKGVHGAPLFSRDGQWLLYGWRGAEPDSVKQQTWRTRVSPVAITRGPDPKRFDGRVYTSIPIVADERGFLPPRETRRPSHLYIVPFAGGAGGEARQLTSGDLSQTSPAWSPDGKTIVFVQDSTETIEVRDEPRPQLYLLTVADGSIRQLATGFPESGDPAWSPDGKVIAFSCSKGRGQENDLCVIPAGGGAARNLTADWSLDPGSPAWSPDGKTLYFSAETRGNLHLFAVAATGGAVRQVTTGERQLRGFSHSADGRSVAYAASDITHPAEVFVATLTGGGAGAGAERRLTSFNDSLLAKVALIPADTFWFTGVGGLRIQGWLMKPHGYQSGKTYPLVLSIHGGPHSNYGNVLFPEFQMLAGQGYWMLFTNPRGSSGYGHTFTFATRGRWGMEDYQDLMQAVDVAIARGGVDTTRMAVLGGSYGGFMTNWIVGHTNRFRVAQTDRSIFNWYSWYGSSDAQGLTDYEFFGEPWAGGASDSLYRVLSPMSYAKNIRTPMLIVHSEDDKRTPITDGEQLFLWLRKRGVPAEFVRYPRSYHGLSRTGPPWLLVDRLERIRTWFAHWIGTGDAPPAAAASLR
ncbi:MAG TPA: S9 family peptidase [Gemmatimonadales bacterium]|jgi:dipeptidyl aminopeptidase/acylaminoacyl peptidase|nr:S9 family peptidase [Gemmatimonadales bacterium]